MARPSPVKAHVSSSPSKPLAPQGATSRGIQPLLSSCCISKPGKCSCRVRALAPVTYYVMRGEQSSFQCSDSARARSVYEEALGRGEDVEMLITDDEQIALNYLAMTDRPQNPAEDGFELTDNGDISPRKMPEEYQLYRYLRPLVFEELQQMKLKDDENPFQFPSTFPEPTRRLYSYLLEPERSEPDWREWIRALSAIGCPADCTTRVMVQFPWDIQYIKGGFGATVKFSYVAYDPFHNVIFVHPVSVLIEVERVVEYTVDGIEVMQLFPEEEEEYS
ncbi:hypothetical protein C8J56DRAFT_888518 [Mycena floridula]|nr:hypothetical protein C8J56DRAFT_888518 [Mycena floridula]